MIAINTTPIDGNFPYRRLWPLILLIAAELVTFTISYQDGLTITPFSITVAIVVLLTGLLPALLRPSAYTRLAAALGILAAAVLVVPFDLLSIPPQGDGMILSWFPVSLLLRLFNGSLAICVGFHLLSRFPSRSLTAEQLAPSSRILVLCYAITVILILSLLVTVRNWARLAFTLSLVAWLCGLVGWGLYQLIFISRDQNPNYQLSAQQARLLLFGGLVAQGTIVVRLILFWLGLGHIPYNIVLALQISIPLAVSFAILRHDLFGIDVTVRRALAYGLLTSVLLTVYFGLTMLLTVSTLQIVPEYRGLVTMVVLLVAAVVFRPLHREVRGRIEQALYPERTHFQSAIAEARNTLGRVVGHQAIVDLLTKSLPRRIDAQWAALALAPAPAVPPGRAPVWNAPLIAGDRVLGRFWLGARRSNIPYTGEELAILESFIGQAALALAYADTLDALNQLNRELEQQVAERTNQVLEQQRTLAITEERRRLARDLHDSVTQALFSLSLGARALQKVAVRDPDATVDGLRDQEAAAQQALAEMRALLAQLRNPVVADGDLAQALRHQTAMLRQLVGLEVQLEIPDTLPLAPNIAHELLHVAREALHNVVKHSGVDQARCCVHVCDGQLNLVVSDQGQGFDAETAADSRGNGIGLQSMRERVAALGGTIQIDSARGSGSRITVTIPVDSPQSTVSR